MFKFPLEWFDRVNSEKEISQERGSRNSGGLRPNSMATSDPEQKINKQLGEILLEKGVISKAQLEAALKKQGREMEKYMGQVIMEIGVPQEKVNQLLLYSNKRKPIGQILIDLGVITAEELQKAVEKQKE